MVNRIKIPEKKLLEKPEGIKDKLGPPIVLQDFRVGGLLFQDFITLDEEEVQEAKSFMRGIGEQVPIDIKCVPRTIRNHDVKPIKFRVSRHDNFFGAWSFFHIVKQFESTSEVQVTCTIAPIFSGMGTDSWDRTVKFILTNLLNRELPTADGRNFIIVGWDEINSRPDINKGDWKLSEYLKDVNDGKIPPIWKALRPGNGRPIS